MNRVRALSLVALGVALAAIVAGCGSSDSAPDQQAPSVKIPGSADAAATQVIDAWAKALSSGEIDTAAASFDLPSVAQNGSPEVRLETREQVRVFNEALPCGAKLVRAAQTGKFTIATFELTERPGGECGQGVGLEAMTAFVIEDGLITEWRRVADLPPVETGPVV